MVCGTYSLMSSPPLSFSRQHIGMCLYMSNPISRYRKGFRTQLTSQRRVLIFNEYLRFYSHFSMIHITLVYHFHFTLIDFIPLDWFLFYHQKLHLIFGFIFLNRFDVFLSFTQRRLRTSFASAHLMTEFCILF